VQDSILPQLSRIRAISFDGDMTLWDFDKVMRRALAYALAELRGALPGRALAKLTIDKMIEIVNAVSEELKGQTVSLEKVRLAAFVRTVAEVGEASDHLAKHLNAYLKHRFEDIELYPDVVPTLEAIAGRYVLGLVSNGNSYPE
jgi:FMN phosphatase YigB (HAD superfamily)